MASEKKVQVPISLKFTGDIADLKRQIVELEQQIRKLSEGNVTDNSAIGNIKKDFTELQKVISKSGNMDTSGIKKSVNDFNKSYSTMSANAVAHSKKIADGFDSLKEPIQKGETQLDKFGRTLVNSLRYNVVNNFVDNALSQFGEINSFLEDVDKNLNNIRIVSSKTQAEMYGFLETANSSARDLGSITNSYLEGSEIYYQQGLSTNEVITRTEATLKSANIAGQNVGTTADQITAILNGFNVSASQTVDVLGKIAQVGAGTATDFEEIAKATQKVSNSALEANISIDKTLGMIATISSVTREAPEAIGTSLNAIISRFNNLSVAEGEYTSQIEKALSTTGSGLSIFDEQTGMLKGISDILDQLSGKWNTLDVNQQKTITSAIAGTRQANRLMALLNNYDTYQEYTKMSEESEGALDEQNKIYLQSLQAIKNESQAAKEALYNELFNPEMLKDYYSFITDIFDTITSIVEKIGGLGGVITPLLGLLRQPILNMIGPSVTRFAQNRIYGQTTAKEYDERVSKSQADYNNARTDGVSLTLLSAKEKNIALTEREKEQYNELLDLLNRQTVLRNEINNQQSTLNTLQEANTQDVEYDLQRLSIEKEILQVQEKYNQSAKERQKIEKAYYKKQYEESPDKRTLQAREYKNAMSASSKSYKTDLSGQSYDTLPEIIGRDGEMQRSLANTIAVLEKTKKTSTEQRKTQIQQEINLIKEQISELNKLSVKITETMSGASRSEANNILQLESTKKMVTSIQSLEEKVQNEIKETLAVKTKVANAWEILTGKQAAASAEEERAIVNAARVETEALQQQLNSAKKANVSALAQGEQKETEGIGWINTLKSSTKLSKALGVVSMAGMAAAGGLQMYKSATDDSLTTSQKAEGVIAGFGSALSMLPGVSGLVGMAISTLGPILLEVFGLGQSEIEKLTHKLDAAKKSFDSFASSVRQQAADLSSVEKLYDKLAEQYQQQAFTYDQLTEEQQSQYDQVAEYIENYAPELIKYYTAEGKAIIDLSKQYNDAEKNKKGFLRSSLETNELLTYNQLQGSSNENASLLLKQYGLATGEIETIQNKISKLRTESLTTGKDVSEQLTSLEEQLATNKNYIKDMASDWDNMVTKVITKGSVGFSTLDDKVQDSITRLASYNSFINSEIGLDEEAFQSKIKSIISSIYSMNDEVSANFSNLTSGIRDQVLKLALDMELSAQDLSDFLSTITDNSFLSGEFLSDFSERSNQRIQETKDRLAELNDQLAKLKEREDALSYSNLGKETYIGSAQSAMEASGQASTGSAVNEEQMQSVEEQIDDITELLQNAENESKLLHAEWQDGVREFANSSSEAYNQVAESYNKMREELEKGVDASGNILSQDDLSDLENRVGMTYAVLQGDNEQYYNDWKAQNANTLDAIAQQYGISADNYRTYNEYKTALDENQAKLKVLYEVAAAEGAEAVNQKLFEYKKQNMIQELVAEGNLKDASLLLVADQADAEEVIANNLQIEKLQKLKDELEAQQAEADGSIKLSAEQASALEGNLVGFVNNTMNAILKTFGGETVASALGGAGTAAIIGGYSTSKSGAVAAAQAKIDQLSARNEEIRNQSKYKDLLASAESAITGISDFENYIANLKYNTGNYGDIALKPVGTSSAPNNLGDVQDSSKDKKDVEDLKFDLNPLKKYIDKLEELNHEIEVLQKEREKLYGKEYIDNLNKEVEINKQSLKVENEKLEKIKEISKEYQNQLSKSGVQFDENGLITNYNEILAARQLAVNALTGDAKESAKTAAEELKDLMDNYEEYALEKKREAESAIQDLKAELSDLAREKIQYPIELIVNASESDKSFLELVTEIEKYKKGKINFSITAEDSAKNVMNTLKTVQDIFSQTGGGQGFLDSIFNDPNLQGNTKAQMEMIQEQQEKMQDLAGELIKFAESFREAFSDGLEEAISLLEDELSKFDNIVSQYEYLLDLSDKLNINSIDQINTTYGKLTSIYKNNLKQYQAVAESIKKSRDSFEVGTEEWLIANDKYMDAQSKAIEQEKEIADLLGKRYDSVVSTGRKELEEALFNGSTLEETQEQFNKMNSERDKYLDTERKIYELSKLERNISEDINSYQYDETAQAQLKKFMQDELKYLNSKEKLSQNDLDLTSKQYNVVKARIDLERSYNNEQYQLQLQRNADGTFSYMYVQDTSSIKEAEQAYQDAIDELYKYSIKRTKELQEESIDIRSDALSEYDKIAQKLKNGTIDQEEAVELLNKAFDEMKKKLEANAKAQAEMQKQVASSKLLQILGVSESELGGLDNLQGSLKSTFDILANNGEANGLQEVIKSLGLSSTDYIGSVGDQVSKLFQDLGGDKGAMDKLMEAFAKTGNSTAATILSLLNQTGDLSILTNQILQESLNGAGDKFDDFLTQISSGTIKPEDLFTESIKNGLDSVGESWDSLKDIIVLDLDTFVKQFDVANPESILGKVTKGITDAYEEYNKALKDSYDNLIKREEELNQSTDAYNKNLDATVNKIKEEIEQLTEVTLKYANLRQEILNTISNLTKYITLLDQARQKIEDNNKIGATNPGTPQGGTASSGGSSNQSGGSSGGATTPSLGENQRVRIVRDEIYGSAYDSNAQTVYPTYLNSSRTDLFIDGILNGKYRVKQRNGDYVGWFNSGALQAFHEGGKIDVNKEGLAIVKQNEAVFTEQQVETIKAVKNSLDAIKIGNEEMLRNSFMGQNNQGEITQHIQINASFPNATRSSEIELALQNLSVNSSQYINNNKSN